MLSENYLFPRWPAPSNVRAATSLRSGGTSGAPYTAFNLATHVGDDDQSVADNRKRLQRDLRLPAEPQWLEQIHSDRVVLARADGLVRTADASFATSPGAVCAVLTADCLPVLFCDQSGTRVAAAHAGWRGLAGGVLRTSVEALDCDPAELLVWLGPAIGPQAFETGVDVLEAFFENALSGAHTEAIAQCFRPHTQKPLHFLADIYALARAELHQLGVDAIYGGDRCTFTEEAHFYSYRRDKITGRMATLIWLEN
ncbi:peptidoglycan editing factor PgeF [Microbulbifer thermotolerans]|uniref:peptidoglycan editing factor PgeF n=1 Tax=Microbulbifer thermotolerans TaxID=252514 RepID=UPI002248CFBE|nr:peptidoglycan editing factor PgeF [Microbulbifer thermotolerans]MCX2795917.1 peptidoglycan editing factor PgeF [Microbulbifer thermotolerans]MCX2835606.1 peptidoglycan editing factor PgeF [Microbulbifer thermotolerans]